MRNATIIDIVEDHGMTKEQRELNAYRKVGTVEYLRYLKQQDMRRERTWASAMRALKYAVVGAIGFFSIWGLISFIAIF